MTPDLQAAHLLKKWQRMLRLEDWDIDLKFGRFHEISENGFAHVRTKLSTNSAEIMLRVPGDARPEESWPGDNNVELTIVHELLHIKLAPLSIPGSLEVEEERIVESLARTLVRLAGEEK